MEGEQSVAGRLLLTRTKHYQGMLSCSLTIQVPEDKKIILVFRSLEIEYEPLCDDDYLQMFDGMNTSAPTVQGLARRICGHKKPAGSYITTGRHVTVHFNSDTHKQDDGFDLVFTSFHTEKCDQNEYRCRNGRCISNRLECNGYNNCGDGSDECHLTPNAVLGIVIGVFLLTIIAVGGIVVFRKKRLESKRRMGGKKSNKSTVSSAIEHVIQAKTQGDNHVAIPVDLIQELAPVKVRSKSF
ncbi:hypothetical protein ACJMK2_039319 [Sinanodonta woodiana]|uniref:CUB domain-containing protein n=1 Tax=Sinanodonta woodiana TaxID=1069815 RepID=A0ABD3WBK1_SINWO